MKLGSLLCILLLCLDTAATPQHVARGEKAISTNQVADVGQVLVGEDRLSIQVRHVQKTGQHWPGHLISQHWPFLVDISCTQGTVLIIAWHKLLPGRACPETTS